MSGIGIGLRLVHVFLIFALRVWGHLVEAGALTASNKTKYDFDGDENGDECADCD